MGCEVIGAIRQLVAGMPRPCSGIFRFSGGGPRGISECEPSVAAIDVHPVQDMSVAAFFPESHRNRHTS
jgi:hypothetical protein